MHRSLAASTPEGANTTHRHIISLHLQSLITLYCPRLKQLSEVSNQHRLAENGRKAQRTSEQLRRFIYLLLQIHKRVQGKPTVATIQIAAPKTILTQNRPYTADAEFNHLVGKKKKTNDTACSSQSKPLNQVDFDSHFQNDSRTKK